MSIVLLGINHKTAPLAVREQLVFPKSRIREALDRLVDGEAIREGMILSTCNRVEVVASASQPELAGDLLYAFLHRIQHCDLTTLEEHCYRLSGSAAIKHVFRVASSLDSMVVGEPQISGQMKTAFQLAQEAGATGHHLTRLMNRAFAVAKRVRNETSVGSCPVSVSSVAVELARKAFDDLTGVTVMLLGAGEMAELAVKHLVKNGAGRILVANRTYANALKLAPEVNGEVVAFEDIERRLPEADIVVCSTGAEDYLIGPDEVRAALPARANFPILFIDISVPRNLDPAIGGVEHAILANVDDLQTIAASNRAEREREAARAEAIVETEVERFVAAQAKGETKAAIGAFRRQLSDVAFGELARSRKRLGDLNREQEDALQVMLNSIVNRFTQPVIAQLRESKESLYLTAWRDLYQRPSRPQALAA
jgi:glutamyl-tRNA reductase